MGPATDDRHCAPGFSACIWAILAISCILFIPPSPSTLSLKPVPERSSRTRLRGLDIAFRVAGRPVPHGEEEESLPDPMGYRCDDAYIRTLPKCRPFGEIYVIKSPKDEVNPIIQRAMEDIVDMMKPLKYIGVASKSGYDSTVGPTAIALASDRVVVIYQLPEYLEECKKLDKPFEPTSLIKFLQAPVLKVVHDELETLGKLWETWQIDSFGVLDTMQLAVDFDSPNVQLRNLAGAWLGTQIPLVEKEPPWTGELSVSEIRRLAQEAQLMTELGPAMLWYAGDLEEDKWSPPKDIKTSYYMQMRNTQDKLVNRLQSLYDERANQVEVSEKFPPSAKYPNGEPKYHLQIQIWDEISRYINNSANHVGEDEMWAHELILHDGHFYIELQTLRIQEWIKDQDTTETYALSSSFSGANEFLKSLEQLPPRLPKRIKAFHPEMIRMEVNQLLKEREADTQVPHNVHPLLKLTRQLTETQGWLLSLEALEHPRWKVAEARHAALERITEISNRIKPMVELVLNEIRDSNTKAFVFRELQGLQARMNASTESFPGESYAEIKVLEAIRDYLEDKNAKSRPRPWDDPGVVAIAIDMLDSQIATASLVSDSGGIDTSRDYTWLTIKELKLRLREKGLPVSGSKAQLIERLEASDGPPPTSHEDSLSIKEEHSPLKTKAKRVKSASPHAISSSLARTSMTIRPHVLSRRKRGLGWIGKAQGGYGKKSFREEFEPFEYDNSFDGGGPRAPPKKMDIQTDYMMERPRNRTTRQRGLVNEELDSDDDYFQTNQEWEWEGPVMSWKGNMTREADDDTDEDEVKRMIRMMRLEVDSMPEFQELTVDQGPWDERGDEGISDMPQPERGQSPLDPINLSKFRQEKQLSKANSPDMEDENDYPDEIFEFDSNGNEISRKGRVPAQADISGLDPFDEEEEHEYMLQKAGINDYGPDNAMDVFLVDIGLGKLRDAFARSKFADPSELAEISKEELNELMDTCGVHLEIGEKARLRKAWKEIKDFSGNIPGSGGGRIVGATAGLDEPGNVDMNLDVDVDVDVDVHADSYVDTKKDDVAVDVDAKRDDVAVDVDAKKDDVAVDVDAKRDDVAVDVDAKKDDVAVDVDAKRDDVAVDVDSPMEEEDPKPYPKVDRGRYDGPREHEKPPDYTPGVVIPWISRGTPIKSNNTPTYYKLLDQEDTTEKTDGDEADDLPKETILEEEEVLDSDVEAEMPEKVDYLDPDAYWGCGMDLSVVEKETWWQEDKVEEISDFMYQDLRKKVPEPPTKRHIKRLIEYLTRKGINANAIRVEFKDWYGVDVSLDEIHKTRKLLFPSGQEFAAEPRDRQAWVTWNIDWKAEDAPFLFYPYDVPPPASRVQLAPFVDEKERRLHDKQYEKYDEELEKQNEKKRREMKGARRGGSRKSSGTGSSSRQESLNKPIGRVPRRPVGRGGSPGGRGGDSQNMPSMKKRQDRPKRKRTPIDDTDSSLLAAVESAAEKGVEKHIVSALSGEEDGKKRESRKEAKKGIVTPTTEAKKTERSPKGLGKIGEGKDIDFSNLTVAKLKEVLKERGLPTSGRKQELIDRLQQAH
ncbi:hypothetical protein AAMO2058_001432200 [Amorphochlora amoebiformis]